MTEQPAPQEARLSQDPTSGAPHNMPARASKRRWLWGSSAVILAVGIIWLAVASLRPARPILPAGVSESDYARAERDWKNRYHRRPDELDVISWLAESAVNEGDLETAAACFQRIPSSHPVYGRAARHQEGQILQKINRLCAAEQNLREFIRLESDSTQPQHELLVDAIQRLRSILELELRFEERRALLQDMFRYGEGDLFDTLVYRFPSLLRWNGPAAVARAEAALSSDPECFEIRRAIARYRTGQGRIEEAREILTACLREKPSDLPAFTYLLECEYERGGAEAIAEAVDRLPPPADDDPWLLLELRGQVHNKKLQFNKAIDCFERVLRSDPANATCHQGIAAACLGLHDLERRQQELRAAVLLTRIQTRLGRVVMHGPALQTMIEIVETCEELGLDDHALGIARAGLRIYPRSGDLDALVARLQKAKDAVDAIP